MRATTPIISSGATRHRWRLNLRVRWPSGKAACAFVLLAGAALWGCVDPCGNQVVDEQLSPDGKHRVVLFQRDCGAVTDYSTQVSVLSAGQKLPDLAGNTFVAEVDRGKSEQAARGPWGGPDVEVHWASANALRILYAPGSRLLTAEHLIEGVRVSYVTLHCRHPEGGPPVCDHEDR